MEQVTDIAKRMDVFLNIAAKAWPSGVVIAFCPKCGKTRNYDWDAVAKIMDKGLPRHCGVRIDLRVE